MTEEYLTDDEQLERLKRIVAENWLWVAAGIVLGAGLIFGYRYYVSYQDDRGLRAAMRFDDMSAALEANDPAKTARVADGLIADFPGSPYADQALLALAKLKVDAGKSADAEEPLRQVMEHSKDSELRHIARLRLARVLIDEGKPDAAIGLLAGDTPGAFAGLYHAVRGDALYAKKDSKDALTEYRAALDAGGGGADAALLQLKIADLGASPVPASPTVMLPGAH
jgi:predicted negative regulator of RcsB-dependent stress response